ncbi:adhesion G protein-coupled receptor A2 [Neocloeon triangulifer]|uniref:adhesion G protein-coupled receptor A2 n=1 Tax=Neocloeon triangulifer TaxID=2078957 RepID=UPI00286F9D46|nr:adhesion G protein-coupled receptor A2 [Neocloeon triangulifer]XP_059471563.1 adhesion G protein-coupled receptor A2 [Neocloeon triangulifer]
MMRALLLLGLFVAHAWAQEVTPCPSTCRCQLNTRPNNKTVSSANVRQQSAVKVRCGEPGLGKVSAISELDPSLFPKNVTHLDLSSNLLTEISKAAFAHLPQLQKLDLKDNLIRYLAQEAFSNLTNLRRLDLSGNKLSRISGPVFLGLERLNSLKISRNELTSIAEGTFDDLIALKSLDLSSNPLICDCHLAWLVDWLGNESVSVASGSACLSPPHLKGHELAGLSGLVCRPPSQVSLEILPDTDQLVFQGDSLRLSCLLVGPSKEAQVSWTWRGQQLTDIRPTTHFLPHQAMTVSSLSISELRPIHSGPWRCFWGNLSQALRLTVLTPESTVCNATVSEDPRGRYSWPATLSGEVAVVPCPALLGARAARACLDGGRWGPWDSGPCPYLSNITRALQQFAQLSPSRPKEAADALSRLLRFTGDVGALSSSRDIVYLARTLTNHLSALDPTTAPLVLSTVAGAVKLPNDLLQEAEIEDKSCTKMVEASEAVAELSAVSLDAIAVQSFRVNRDTFKGLWCAWYEEKGGKRHLDCGSEHHTMEKEVIAAIEVPASLFLHMPKSNRLSATLMVVVMESASLFPDNSTINSPVIGCKLIGESLTEPLDSTPVWVTAKAPLESMPVAWVNGRWNEVGCAVGRLLGPLVLFHCNSLGYFGLRHEAIPALPTLPPPLPSRLSPAAAYAACLVLGTCLLVAVVTYVASPLSMPASTRHSLANTWLAIVLLSVVFSCGVHLTGDAIVCHSVGLLLHYLTMSCLLWMTVTISDLHSRLTAHEKIIDEDEEEDTIPSGPKPLLGLYLVGWGVGLIICGISGAVHRYTTPYYCFLPPSSAVTAALVPGLIVLMVFGLTWIMAHFAVQRRANDPPPSASSASLDQERTPRSQLLAHLAILLLFLAAWGTAAASIVVISPFSTILSCVHVAVCTALGTTVLLYFCAGRGDVAAEWKAFADPRQWIVPTSEHCHGQTVADMEMVTEQITMTMTDQTTMTIIEKNEVQTEEEPEDEAELLRKIASLRSVVLPPPATTVVSEDTFYDPRQLGVARKFFRRQRLRQNSDAESLFSGGSKVNNTNIHPPKLNNRINLHPNMMNVELSVHKNFFEPPRAHSPMSSISEARHQKSRYLSRAHSADNLEQEKRRRHRTRRKRRRKTEELGNESDTSKQETCV